MIHRHVRKHRSAADWQSLIHQWQSSGLSAPAFCLQNQIGYASFCNWRKRLGESSPKPAPATTNDFIDLSGWATGHQDTSWQLWLKLGSVVELRIGRR